LLIKTWRMLAPFVPRLAPLALAMTALGLVGAVAETAALLIAVRVTLSLGAGDGTELTLPGLGTVALLPAMGIALTGALISLLAHVFIARVNAAATAGVLTSVRTRIIRAFVGAKWETQAAEREGALQATATDLAVRSTGLVQFYVNLGTNTIMLVIFLASAALVQPITTLLVVAAGLVVALGLRPVSRATNQASSFFTRANKDYAEHVARFSSTSMEYRVFGVQAAAAHDLGGSSDAATGAQRRTRFFSFLGSSLFRDIAILLLVISIGVLALIGGAETAGVFVVITLVVRGLASAQAVSSSSQLIREYAPNLFLLSERIAHWEASPARNGNVVASDLQILHFDRVGYRYPEGDGGVQDLDLTIRAGEAIGIIGRSGAGKSTFVQLLLRLRTPTSGRILLDGVDTAKFTEASWSSLLGFVPQEPSLLEGTIRSNVDFDRGLDPLVIERAIERAHVAGDIQQLPDGLDTVLGPRGTGLSGGQKQRVAIARALAADPRLLILDEPSSALDPHSERLLVETLTAMKGTTTMVIVAHRHRTVELCDRLVVFDDGRIVQIGTPEELRQTEGYYRSMTADRTEGV